MGIGNRPGRNRRPAPPRVVALTLVGLGAAVIGLGTWLSVRQTEAGAGITQAMPSSGVEALRKQMPIPVRISIPAIGVDARVIPLGLNRDRTIQVPKNFANAGWFRPGPEPGEQGAAVVVGHLDSTRGPGVFYRLRALRTGDVITIHLQDRSTVRFVARSTVRVPKNRFPTKRVYARTKQPTLRLITCAGKLNPTTGHHPDNYIVFASIVGKGG
jgi:sortase (surface protein transpeptidase)